MADSIRIDVGKKRVLINDGPDFLEFNPSDVIFVERFHEVVGTFEAKLESFKSRAVEIDANTETDANGLPANLGDKLAMLKELCGFAHEQIDNLFGPGTSQKLFQGAMSMEMVEQFFEGITPYIKDAREEKVARYKAKNVKKTMR